MAPAPGGPRLRAGVAQLVAQTTCNRQVVGSIPTAGSHELRHHRRLSPAGVAYLMNSGTAAGSNKSANRREASPTYQALAGR
jgi:hypothetical protein